MTSADWFMDAPGSGCSRSIKASRETPLCHLSLELYVDSEDVHKPNAQIWNLFNQGADAKDNPRNSNVVKYEEATWLKKKEE